MPISPKQRRRLIVADRSFDPAAIAAAVRAVLAENPALSLLDAESALRDAAAWSFLIAAPGGTFEVAAGVLPHRARLAALDRSPAENLTLLAASRAANVAAKVAVTDQPHTAASRWARAKDRVVILTGKPHGVSTNAPLLSPREKRLLRRLAAGKTDRQIAWRLGGTIEQISEQRVRLLRKLKINSQAEIVDAAERLAKRSKYRGVT
ncbi:helix-turn-helix transcriptional regulator [Bradyrhizobium sp. S3.5.5]|uniref:helix-turn-helix transcriptional regulator n=1 Tax=Bradyrhizobium sp. S3.5.5 TaxID=3156430 RepID=UPI003395DADF